MAFIKLQRYGILGEMLKLFQIKIIRITSIAI